MPFGLIDRSGGSKESSIRWGSHTPIARGKIFGEMERCHVTYRENETLWCVLAAE